MSGLIGLAESRTGVIGKSGGKDLAKAWGNFNGGGTPDFRSDYNFSTIDDQAVGKYFLNFVVNMTNADYAWCGFAALPGAYFDDVAIVAQDNSYNNSTSQLQLSTMIAINPDSASSPVFVLGDCVDVSVIVFGE